MFSPVDASSASRLLVKGSPELQALPCLTTSVALAYAAAALGAFHTAYQWEAGGILIVGYLAAMYGLAWVRAARVAFYLGLAIGFGVAAPQLAFFRGVFGPAAIGLWLILGLWQAAFLLTAHAAVRRRPVGGAFLIPVIWLGVEYFRSELYYLRFSWLTPGFALSHPNWIPLAGAGMYGFSFLTLLLLAVVHVAWRRRGNAAAMLTAAICAVTVCCAAGAASTWPTIRNEAPAPLVVGIQLEGASDEMLLAAMERAIREHPELDILVLAEYAFDGPVPDEARGWCRRHEKHLIAGGKRYLDSSRTDYENTAFVIGPDGAEIFRQVKSVPVQFMQDGVPATTQKVWSSPWGRIGIAICYDLSYARVTDALIRAGAQALIVPAMDLIEWGEHEHELHAKVAPVRSREYGVPILRVLSSGISQFTDRRGRVLASAPFPGQNELVVGRLELGPPGRLPLDRYIAIPCVVVTIVLMVGLWMEDLVTRRRIQGALPANAGALIEIR